MTYYILDEAGQPQQVTDVMTWGQWHADNRAAMRVDQTQVDGVEVSTVFLAIDHNFFGGPPLLYETMTFGETDNGMDGHQWRYHTREAAQAGHDQVVDALRSGVPLNGLDVMP